MRNYLSAITVHNIVNCLSRLKIKIKWLLLNISLFFLFFIKFTKKKKIYKSPSIEKNLNEEKLEKKRENYSKFLAMKE